MIRAGDKLSREEVEHKLTRFLMTCKSKRHFKDKCNRFFYGPDVVIRWGRGFRAAVVRRQFLNEVALRPELIFVSVCLKRNGNGSFHKDSRQCRGF